MKWRVQCCCCFLVCLCLCSFMKPSVALLLVHDDNLVEVISIIDASCVLSSYIKIFSIIKSSKRPKELSFRFLVLDDLSFDRLEKMYKGCFSEIKVQFKRWTRPSTLPPLSNKGFDSEYIYSRVYLADIFHEVDRYIYLDNDVIVNVDISEVFHTPLIRASHPLTSRLNSPIKPSKGALQIEANMRQSKKRIHDGRQGRQGRQTSTFITPTTITSDEHESKHKHKHESKYGNGKKSNGKKQKVVMGFVFDVNEKLSGYVKNGFNQDSELFKRAISFIEPAKFFNGGVALVDARKWRADNMTRRAEAIILENQNESLYSAGLGDQGLFFLLLQEGVAELHPAFNMRRVPNKTTRFLKRNLGIVHFAGTTRGNARTLCIDPLQYPVLSAGAVPLYLAVVKAFFESCPMQQQQQLGGDGGGGGGGDDGGMDESWLSVKRTCLKAINRTRTQQLEGKLHIDYLPGRSRMFAWPPS